MQVSKEEILHIANLAELTLEENEVETYMLNLQDILRLKLNKKDQEAFNNSCEIMKETIKKEIEPVLRG